VNEIEQGDFVVQKKVDLSARPHVVILGAGPAGVGAAFRLMQKGTARVTVLEQQSKPGGNAGSFELDGIYCDYGSHRLFSMLPAEIMEDLRRLMGPDLLYRVRHGSIRLRGHWIHFPLKPMDLLFKLPKSFALGVLGDTARKLLPRASSGTQTFATVLERGLGRTVCRDFFFPYARKIWGVAPEKLDIMAAQRRVTGSSIGKILRKVANQIPGLRPQHAGRFYYPRRGFGQITECLSDEAQKLGADFKFGARFLGIERKDGQIKAVRYQLGGEVFEIPAGIVLSTIPITVLVQGMHPEPPREVLDSSRSITYRGMILIYLVLEQDRFGRFDAYYFPEEAIPISRLSESKNFNLATEPRGRTVLCAELPSDPGRPEWTMSDRELGDRLCEWMGRAGLPVSARVSNVITRRLRQAYPVYLQDYATHLSRMDDWLNGIQGMLTFGRQGLFAHDNTHHALPMAYAAADCLSPEGVFDRERWAECRQQFKSDAVED
jgi:protoporphyrinogen oxidase